MASTKRPRLPFILSANALVCGSVVYRASSGWSMHLGDAIVAMDEETAAALESARLEAEGGGEIVEPELFSVGLDEAGQLIPLHYRERIRALGPTVRPDLGPQAQGLHGHVSL